MIPPTRNYESDWMDKLAQQARILGEARMLRDEEPCTDEKANLVIERFKAYLERTGKSMAWAARSLGIASGTLSPVLSGTYAADAEPHIRAIDKWIEQQIAREQAPKPAGFVKTGVAQQIYGVARWICKTTPAGIGVVHAPSGCGKTMALKAIAAETPGSVFISIRTAGQSKLSVLESLATALRLGEMKLTSWQLSRQIENVLKDTGRLIIVDEVHKLAGRQNDEALHALRDLHDATGCPMLWSGMTKIANYIQDGNAQGYDPIEQIFSRITMWLNLTEIATQSDGGPGLYSIDDIRKVFSAGKIRLTPDAERYLQMLANEPKLGCLRTCVGLVSIAIEFAKGEAINAQLLKDIRAQQFGVRVAQSFERQMELRTKVG